MDKEFTQEHLEMLKKVSKPFLSLSILKKIIEIHLVYGVPYDSLMEIAYEAINPPDSTPSPSSDQQASPDK